MTWIVEEKGWSRDRITTNGNKFMLGNGYMGYRGTLEEFSKEQLTACTLAGVYDKVGDSWREPVNAPNGLYTRIYCDGEPLGVLDSEYEEHAQSLNIRNATFARSTLFKTTRGSRVKVESERFVSAADLHLIVMKYAFTPLTDCEIRVETGINGDVWDINGPHLEEWQSVLLDDAIVLEARSHEQRIPIVVAERVRCGDGNGVQSVRREEKSVLRSIVWTCEAGRTYELEKCVAVYTGLDRVEDPRKAATAAVRDGIEAGYGALLQRHDAEWERKWAVSDVEIDGDYEAQFALRYSIYQLLIIAPTESEKVSIPARGLSGQVYKGAVFWDTEMFMLPFFLYTNPEIARNLVMYRVHTLDGARRKAAEYGYRGAFYAWESQETGDDACTLFNVTDVFTGRPMRTYFRDKQIHISADAAFGIWEYFAFTGDASVLLDGGAEVILECARFFYSYAYYKEDKNRYELLDVTGPDEYHERVNNNAFTSRMAKEVLVIAERVLGILEERFPESYDELIRGLNIGDELAALRRMKELLYVPEPDDRGIIEQFDGYYKLEDASLEELKARVINKNEYLGGGSGLATTTQILKQADVVLMLHLFKSQYSQEVKKANWDFYEPRTEHGSSLSPCVYAMVASDIGYSEWGYRYFMRTATIDLTGDSKQYVGTLYIGGTHPAANGGAWMAAVFGFAGVHADDGVIQVRPALPERWNAVRFGLLLRGQSFRLEISKNEVRVSSATDNRLEQVFAIAGVTYICQPGGELRVRV